MPFCLEEPDLDLYKDDSVDIFHFKCDGFSLKVTRIQEFFDKMFGASNIVPIFGEKLEFFLTFQESESSKKLLGLIKSMEPLQRRIPLGSDWL